MSQTLTSRNRPLIDQARRPVFTVLVMSTAAAKNQARGRVPWSSGYSRRLMVWRLWVQFPLVVKFVMRVWKDENKRKRGRVGPFKKNQANWAKKALHVGQYERSILPRCLWSQSRETTNWKVPIVRSILNQILRWTQNYWQSGQVEIYLLSPQSYLFSYYSVTRLGKICHIIKNLAILKEVM